MHWIAACNGQRLPCIGMPNLEILVLHGAVFSRLTTLQHLEKSTFLGWDDSTRHSRAAAIRARHHQPSLAKTRTYTREPNPAMAAHLGSERFHIVVVCDCAGAEIHAPQQGLRGKRQF